MVAACSGGSEGSGTDSALDGLVAEWAADNGVTAVSVSVRSPVGGFTFARGGDRDPTAASLYEVGSLTKTMVAATVMLLVEDGALDLDEPIERWLPEFPRADELSLRQLLSHTAGLGDGARAEGTLDDLAEFLEPTTPEELLAAAAELAGSSAVPAPWSYANSGFWVVGAIVEAATGESLEAVMRLRLLQPLGMDDTYLAWSEPVDADLVPGELAALSGDPIVLGTEVLPGMVSAAWAAGGVVSSSSDMAVFYGALLDDLLSPESMEAMTTRAAGATYGLGLDARAWAGGLSGWGHNGAIPGYSASAAIGNQGWTVAVLTNHFRLTSDGIAPDVETFVGEVLRLVVPSS